MKRFSIFLILSCLNLGYLLDAYLQTYTYSRSTLNYLSRSNCKLYATNDEKRKSEISRKIRELKKAGKITPNNDKDSESSTTASGFQNIKNNNDQYSSKLSEKLGRKANYLGIDTGKKEKSEKKKQRKGKIGSVTGYGDDEFNILDPELSVEEFDDDLDDDDLEKEDDEETDEAAMLEIVAEKLRQKRAAKQAAEKEAQGIKLKEMREKLEKERESQGNNAPRTSGIGGAFAGRNETAIEETYRPSRGSWGYFERPKDISKAYGGGRRVGIGSMSAAEKEESYERTRQVMREYNRKMGIEVESEKEHAVEIDDALKIAKLAMQRGIYATAVSALEKVTSWCSSNSKVGSKVFLELAMAYEAVGRVDEAMQVYTKLSTCRMEDVKNNAKKLLYGLESYEFMKDADVSSFSNRKKASQEYREATGFDAFCDKYDTGYSTYVDTSSDEYKALTANVVRSVREARQIILKAVDSGIVERTKVVQALRSLSRGFDDALDQEKDKKKFEQEKVAMIDGVPVIRKPPKTFDIELEFKLASPEVTLESLSGEWRLQLVANRKGNGVKYYNTTVSWLQLDTNDMQYSREGQVLFLPITETGGLDFDGDNRILRRKEIEASGGGSILEKILGQQDGTLSSEVPQEIMIVDSIIMITRCAEILSWQDENKDYFAVWRRVEDGTFSSSQG